MDVFPDSVFLTEEKYYQTKMNKVWQYYLREWCIILSVIQPLHHSVWCSPWQSSWLHQSRLVNVGGCHGKWGAGKRQLYTYFVCLKSWTAGNLLFHRKVIRIWYLTFLSTFWFQVKLVSCPEPTLSQGKGSGDHWAISFLMRGWGLGTRLRLNKCSWWRSILVTLPNHR